MRTDLICFAAALSVAPGLANAKTLSVRIGAASSIIHQSRIALVPASGPAPIITFELRQRASVSQRRGVREAGSVWFADEEVRYIEGPSWDYRTSRRGPMFEVAALGGGLEDAPYLAHVAMNWRF